jgi:hypothetical protein
MRPGRLLLLLLTAIPGLLGAASRMPDHPPPSSAPGPSISSPRESLPAPKHNEATCPFCQAALFPPCAPTSAAVLLAPAASIRQAVPVPDTRVRHVVTARPPSSRAPPTLRFV